jgi:hypothetical protein
MHKVLTVPADDLSTKRKYFFDFVTRWAILIKMPRVFSGRCFNRPIARFEWTRDELEKWAASGDSDEMAMGANIESDWRVSDERGDALEAIPLDIGHAGIPLRTRVTDSPARFNYNIPDPAFLKPANNANIQTRIHGNTQLVTVFQFKFVHRYNIAAALPGGLVSAADFDALNSELSRLFPDVHSHGSPVSVSKDSSDFLDRFFANQYSSGQYHGIWTGLWRNFEAHLHRGASAWLCMLGMRCPKRRTLCLVLRYRVAAVRPLVRPTVLDAGWYPEHFPNPLTKSWLGGASVTPPLGGHPMNTADFHLPLRDEFIHRDVARSASWLAAWGWVGPTPAGSAPFELALRDARSRHYSLLQRSYDKDEVIEWLSSP